MILGIKYIYNNVSRYISYHRHIKQLGLSYDEYAAFTNNLNDNLTNVTESNLFGHKIYRTNKFWFAQCVIELFVDQVYWFKTERKDPIIIDCGSNIGLSIIFFKRLYPESYILAFEADENISNISRKNIAEFNLTNVDIINSAVWISDGEMTFLSDNSLGGRLDDSNLSDKNKIKTIRLKSYLDQYDKIDFLKIDIEGAEYEVIMDCSDSLNNVSNLFIEYHSFSKDTQHLNEILDVLTKAGFRYYIKEAWNIMTHPFIDKDRARFRIFDLQLNIFAYR